MATRRASDILASLRLSSRTRLSFSSMRTYFLCSFFRTLPLVLCIEFYIPKLDLILFCVKLFMLFSVRGPVSFVFLLTYRSLFSSRSSIHFARCCYRL